METVLAIQSTGAKVSDNCPLTYGTIYTAEVSMHLDNDSG